MSDKITIKDSGTRRDFGTGSVRDAASGKGRMDLLPVFAITALREYHKGWGNPLTSCEIYLPNVTACITETELKEMALQFGLDYVRGIREINSSPRLIWATYLTLVALDLEERADREIPEGWGVGQYIIRRQWFPWFAMERVSKLYEAGCRKYGDRNWEKGQPLHIFMDSGLRHLMKNIRGDEDEDHLTAAAWNFLCCLETEIKINEGYLPKKLAEGLPDYPVPLEEGPNGN